MQAKNSMMQEFKDFLWSGGLIMIAVGLILAGLVNAVIESFIEGIFKPILAAIVGKPDFNQLSFKLGKAHLLYGVVLTAIINLILTGFVLFLLVKAYKSYEAKKKAAGAAAPTEVDLLTEIRDSLKNR